MALSKDMLDDCKSAVLKLLERRQKYAIKAKVDYRIKNQSIEVFERHHDETLTKGYFDYSVAKITFVNTTQQWKIYWMRGSLRWTSYRRVSQVATIHEALTVIDADEDRLFWGIACDVTT
ncbi:DUF3024 domain-containing protein [Thalassomonas viridans]|uniref:DUF3024 domain-containing protein n=1 Tax=Thalassomonas viridans TaxID=137584 RepID=A0AAE9Z1K5_9GAMM|nr:DUF3024 domain-containing protein [Thalassomonas viridans]WDE04359.1 DUF3024 domain-containing protein [Thalassomonas viridans]